MGAAMAGEAEMIDDEYLDSIDPEKLIRTWLQHSNQFGWRESAGAKPDLTEEQLADYNAMAEAAFNWLHALYQADPSPDLRSLAEDSEEAWSIWLPLLFLDIPRMIYEIRRRREAPNDGR